MPYQAKVFRVLIASPRDVRRERQTISDVIHAWNSLHAQDLNILLQPVMYERDATPTLGARPQEIVNKQIVRGCDILIAVFWTRLGTPTGEADSGTVEEIREFQSEDKPILIYFSSAPVRLDSVESDQYERLQRFRKQLEKDGLLETYDDIPELREKLFAHLTRTVRELVKSQPDVINRIDEALTEAKRNSVDAIMQQWTAVLDRFEAEWANERESQPASLAVGKDIVYRLSAALLDLRTQLKGKVAEAFVGKIDDAIRNAKHLLRHEMMLDGGVSYRAFWSSGDTLFDSLRNAARGADDFILGEQTATGAVNGAPATFTYLGTKPKPLESK
jgi:hypothetical protein